MPRFSVKKMFVIFFFISSCQKDSLSSVNESDQILSPNILLVIADDMGLDVTPNYMTNNVKPSMPNLLNLISKGLTFNNVWSNSVCSPTRATILTGKYGFRTGMLRTSPKNIISNTEVSVFDVFKSSSKNYATGLIGKWHLSNNDSDPIKMGIDYFAGLTGGGVQSYTNWQLTENGQTKISNTYSTSKITDLSISWINNQTGPWFLWTAYNSPHSPFHLPPNELHKQGNLPSDPTSINSNPFPYYLAMIEAMDHEMGRLFNSIDKKVFDNTIVIFLGDNGTPSEVVQSYNSRRAKGSIYQGGIHVPMIIAGKDVSRINQKEDALINASDLFATICEIAGIKSPPRADSESFKTLLSSTSSEKRNFIFSEKYNEQNSGIDRAVRNNTHKYIMFNNGDEELYNLHDNALEKPNLMNPSQLPLNKTDQYNKDLLVEELNRILN